MALTEADYHAAAHEIGCDVAAIKAVDTTEAAGSGFLASGEPKILFEAHIFSRLTDHKYDASYPDISSAKWNRALYKGGRAEHDRLSRACTLNREAALQSASWGRFQIMGFNWERAGYATLQAFVNAMYRSEADHLSAFVNLVQSMGLDDELRRHDWAGFARGYNGPSYAENNYDTRLAAAYATFQKGVVA